VEDDESSPHDVSITMLAAWCRPALTPRTNPRGLSVSANVDAAHVGTAAVSSTYGENAGYTLETLHSRPPQGGMLQDPSSEMRSLGPCPAQAWQRHYPGPGELRGESTEQHGDKRDLRMGGGASISFVWERGVKYVPGIALGSWCIPQRWIPAPANTGMLCVPAMRPRNLARTKGVLRERAWVAGNSAKSQ
jgi:hypothetical protein